MEMYQGKAPDLHLGTALNQGMKVEEDSTGREPEEGALQSSHRKEFADGTALATVCFAPPTGPKEQWDAQWQQFLKTMEAPSLKAGNSEGSCHCWTVLPTSEEACSVSRAQQREIVPQVPFGSSEEARGPPDRMPAKRVAREETSDQAGVQERKRAQGATGSDREPQGFRELCYEETEGPRKVCGKLRELCYQWLEPKRHSKEEILDLVILEQFLAILPSEMQAWVKRGRPETSSLAVSLAEKFLHQQKQPPQPQPQEPRRWVAPVHKSVIKESAQFPEVKQAGSKPGQQQLLKDPKEEENYILIEEDEKTPAEAQHQTERPTEVEPPGQFFRKPQRSDRPSVAQKYNGPETRKGKCPYPLRTYENRVKTKAFQTVPMHHQDPERWEHPTCRAFDKESAQFLEAEEAGSEPEEELVFQEIRQDGHCVLIGEDGKATVEELHPPEIVVELESSEGSFREAQRASEISRAQHLNTPEKKKEKSSNSLRTYENRAKNKSFQTVLMPQQEPERWEPPTCRTFEEESAQFPEAKQAGSEPGQELMFQEITPDGHVVLIGEDGKATTEEQRRPEVVVELESPGPSFREARPGAELSRSQQLRNPEKRKEKSSSSLRTYEKRVKTKTFQTVLVQPPGPARWEPPTCRTFDEESAQFPEAKEAGSEPGQELMFQEITPDGHVVLIGEDGKVTGEEQQPADVAVKAEPSRPPFKEAQHRTLKEAETRKDKSSNSLRTYENRVKTKAFQAALMPPQDPGPWEPLMCQTASEQSAQVPEATQAGSEPGQELFCKEIKEEEDYVLIGADGKVAVEETLLPKTATGVGSERQAGRGAQQVGEVTLHQKCNDLEKKRSSCSYSLKTNVKKIKTEVFETDPMLQQDLERSGALMCKTPSEQSVQVPEATQTGSEPGQELFCKEIKEEEDYVLIAEDGKAYKEEQHQPDSFIEVELSRQLFGEDQCDDETSTYKKKTRSKSFPTGPTEEEEEEEEEEEDESECRRLFRKELDLATDEDTSSGEHLYKLSGFGETSGQGSVISVAPKRARSRRKPHACSECGKSFIYRSILFAHQRIHTGTKPYQCSDCGKTFGRQEDLSTHQRRVHASERPYGCLVCGKHFSLLPDLAEHKRIHTGERLYQCGGEHYAHLRANASDKPYACSDCGKRFVKKRELLTHQMMHTGEKPFECPSCGKCFMYRSILLAHQRMHAEENAYGCLDCGQTFSVQINLLTHQRRSHQGNNQTGDPCGGDTLPSVQSANGSAET